MHACRPVSSRALFAALWIGILPAALAFGITPASSELGDVEIWSDFDLPIAAAALAVWVASAFSWAPRLPRVLLRPIALALAVVPTLVAMLSLPTAISNDERAYLLQAELLASGHLSLPLTEPREALRRRQLHEDTQRGRIYPKYSPGTAAALAPGVLLGLPALMVAAAGLLDLLLVAAVARRLDVGEPWLAALLLASCPLFLLLQTSFQSEVFTLPAALTGYLALLSARSGNARRGRSGLAIGACAGWILLTRPLSGAVFAAAMSFGLVVPGSEQRAPGARSLFGALLGGLPFAAVFLLYDRTLTGDPFLTPYAAYAARFSPWDVYPLFRSESVRLPLLAVARNTTLQLARWLPALFGILGAAGIGAFGLWRLRHRDGGAGLALLLLLIAAYGLHWYPGHWAYLGPIYAFEALGLMVVAAVAVLEDAPPGWLRGLPLLALIAGAVFFAYRFPMILEHAELRAAPQRAARIAELPENAVVLLPKSFDPDRRERSQSRYTPSRPPFASGVIFVRQLDRRAQTRDALTALGLAGRPVFRFVPDDAGAGGRLDPYDP